MGRRFFKIASLAIIACLAAAALALGIFIDRTATAPELKPRIETAAAEFLGRPVTIDALEWRRWPSATLVAKNFRLYEDPLQKTILIDVPVVEAHIALLSVFKLAAGITELKFVSPRVSLRRDEAGEWNVVRLADELAARPDEPSRSWGTVVFNWFAIEGGTVTIQDKAGDLSTLPPFDVSGSGKLRFGRKHLHFPFELAGRLERSNAAVQINGDLGGHSQLRVDVKDAEPSLARAAWPPASRWKGRWDGTLRYDEKPEIQWRVHLRAEALSLSTSAPTLDLLDLTGDYVPSSSSTFAVVVRSSATELDVKGTESGGALDIDVKSPKADLNALSEFAGSVAAAPAKEGKPWRLKATIAAEDLRYGPAELRGVRAVVSRSTGAYVLESLSFQCLGGAIEANGSYLPSAVDDALRLHWKTAGVNVQDLFHVLGSTRDAGGSADSEGTLVTGLGGRFLPAMNGTVKLDIKNGWTAMPGLIKVLSRLNLSTLFAEALGRHRQRIPFDEAHAAVKITNGKVSSDRPLVLQNTTLQMAFMGTYDLPSQTVDGRLVVNFLTVTDEIIGLIPGVRDILLGKERGLIPIWVEIKGPGDDPKVDVLEARTIAAPVWNTVRHILRLPKTLFEKLKPPKDAKP